MSAGPSADLVAMLRPAGGGLFTVSTGKSEQLALQEALYAVSGADAVEAAWKRALAAVSSAKVAILGVPSDTGAGLVRGAAFGPAAVRRALLDADPGFGAWAASAGVVDVGDVFTVPQLLHDEMLSDAQLEATRQAIYANVDPAVAATLPVSPLSITEAVVDRLLALNPALKVMVLGGDHSVAWPVLAALARQQREPWAIVHPDAHTDLLPARLGVRYCFATWAYHANELVGRGGRLLQIGIRRSGRPREHWESALGVRQIWADDVRGRSDEDVLAEVVAHLERVGARRVYLSNDIDGTDAAAAPSTGAAEPGGLSPTFVRALIRRLGERFELLGADLVEVAPSIGAPEDARRTCEVGASYVIESLRALLARPTQTDGG